MSAREPPAENETRRHVTRAEAAPASLDAVVVEGADAGKRVAIDASGGKILVGASELCDLRLADPTVSRRHASIERTDLGVLLTDLGSTNGTYLGDTRIVAAYIAEGARIHIGVATLEVRSSDAAPLKQRRAASLGRMASSSPRMINVLTLCQKLAPSDVPVVLEGETGTGKERLAESIHEASGRAAHPFVVLDCRTTPRELAEAYLFGEVGADRAARPGIFELAGEGTLLVDEPGDLSLELQAKLLRALDKSLVQRVGDPTPVPVSARIVVATCHDLDRLVEEGRLREDLYHRLAGARIEVPPLRRRREDISALAGEILDGPGRQGFPARRVSRAVRGVRLAGQRPRARGRSPALPRPRGQRVAPHYTRAQAQGEAGRRPRRRRRWGSPDARPRGEPRILGGARARPRRVRARLPRKGAGRQRRQRRRRCRQVGDRKASLPAAAGEAAVTADRPEDGATTPAC